MAVEVRKRKSQNLSPAFTRSRARLGGLALSATRDPKKYTLAAREAFNRKFLDEVDPHHRLPRKERERRAEAARKLFFARIALKRVQSRRPSNKSAAGSSSAATLELGGLTTNPHGSIGGITDAQPIRQRPGR